MHWRKKEDNRETKKKDQRQFPQLRFLAHSSLLLLFRSDLNVRLRLSLEERRDHTAQRRLLGGRVQRVEQHAAEFLQQSKQITREFLPSLSLVSTSSLFVLLT